MTASLKPTTSRIWARSASRITNSWPQSVKDFTFVTNNAVDFRRLFRREAIHAGLVIIVPNVVPAMQRALFASVLDYVGDRDLTNCVVEVCLEDQNAVIQEYELPAQTPQRAPDRERSSASRIFLQELPLLI